MDRILESRIYNAREKAVKDYMAQAISFLEMSGKLRPVDYAAMGLLAYHLDTLIAASRELAEKGVLLTSSKGNIRKNPAVDVANGATRQAMEIMQNYGLTALARKRLERGEVKEEELSPLDQYFKDLAN